jgi:hypothetical protein
MSASGLANCTQQLGALRRGSHCVQLASSYERVTRIGLPKRASYNPTNAGVNIASNTLTCFSARLGLLPRLRRCRYLGQAKTHLQHLFTAAALNLARLDAWLHGKLRAQTRHSRLSALVPNAA